MKYRRRKATPAIDWDSIDFVVGTRADVTRTGIKRPCSRCGEDVFTSRRYPERVSMICEYCALEIVEEEEAAKRSPATDQAKPAADRSLLDPWQRTLGTPSRRARPPGRRRLGPKPGDGANAGGA